MATQESYDYGSALATEYNTKINDLEERQRILKERVILIGQNLIELREDLGKEVLDLKLGFEDMKKNLIKVKDAILRLGEDLEKRARKSEVDLLVKQAKMFSPLDFVRKKEE